MICEYLEDGICKLNNMCCKFKKKENCIHFKRIEPPNIHQIERCCATCKYGGHGYDAEAGCYKYGGTTTWCEVCDDWEENIDG